MDHSENQVSQVNYVEERKPVEESNSSNIEHKEGKKLLIIFINLIIKIKSCKNPIRSTSI